MTNEARVLGHRFTILFGEWIFDFDAEVFLTGVEVFGPNALGAGLLGGGDDHGIAKM